MTTTEQLRSDAEERRRRDEAFRRQVDEENRTAEGHMPVPECLCADHFPDLRREDHDRILGVEAGGIRALVLLLEDFGSRYESMRRPGELGWFELDEFIRMHNWQDPVAMYRLGRLVDFWQRGCVERDRLKHPDLCR